MGEEAGARMIVVYGCVCAMRERVAGQRRFARETVDGRLGRQRRTAVHRERTVQQGTSQMVHRDQQQHRHFLQFCTKGKGKGKDKGKDIVSMLCSLCLYLSVCFRVLPYSLLMQQPSVPSILFTGSKIRLPSFKTAATTRKMLVISSDEKPTVSNAF